MFNRIHISALLLLSLMLFNSTAWADAIPVELKKADKGWQLLRDGKPYFIRGAGGNTGLQQLATAGGNSIRTWGSDDIEEILGYRQRGQIYFGRFIGRVFETMDR